MTIRNAPIIIPRLFPLPPTINAAQTKNVERTGFINSGKIPVFSQAHMAPARPAIAAPIAKLLAL